jgi:hypothetical protein
MTLARDVPGEALTPRRTRMISLSTTKTYRRSTGFSGAERKSCDLRHMAGGLAMVRIEPPGQFVRSDVPDGAFITEKTASVHVTHILEKLQVTNRSEAGAIARGPRQSPR